MISPISLQALVPADAGVCGGAGFGGGPGSVRPLLLAGHEQEGHYHMCCGHNRSSNYQVSFKTASRLKGQLLFHFHFETDSDVKLGVH